METVGSRISKVVESSGLTKTAFAQRLNVGQPLVSQICADKTNPSDRTIADICREFNVSEKWLRTGEGEMFVPLTRDQELAAFFGRTLSSESPEFVRRLVSVLAHLSVEEWELLEKMATKLADEIKKAPD